MRNSIEFSSHPTIKRAYFNFNEAPNETATTTTTNSVNDDELCFSNVSKVSSLNFSPKVTSKSIWKSEGICRSSSWKLEKNSSLFFLPFFMQSDLGDVDMDLSEARATLLSGNVVQLINATSVDSTSMKLLWEVSWLKHDQELWIIIFYSFFFGWAVKEEFSEFPLSL